MRCDRVANTGSKESMITESRRGSNQDPQEHRIKRETGRYLIAQMGNNVARKSHNLRTRINRDEMSEDIQQDPEKKIFNWHTIEKRKYNWCLR